MRSVAVLFAAGLFALQAQASAWTCMLSPDLVRLLCIAAPGPEPAVDTTTAVVHGTRFPLDRARPWVVDLWSPPTERAFVELLARSTVCYRTPGCSVELIAPGLR